jgi:hypothetical protein
MGLSSTVIDLEPARAVAVADDQGQGAAPEAVTPKQYG